MKRTLGALIVGFVLVASTAHADDAPQAALAEKLFRDGRTLLAEGKLREACASFSESKRLDPTPGTLLNLAHCLEDLGRTASAWAMYRELETRARRLAQTTRADFARDKAAELEPRVPMLELRVSPEHRVAGLAVEYDGTVLGSAAWSSRVPVDPGPHVIVARAPGRHAWSASVTAVASRAAVVDVPLLAPVAATEPVPGPGATDGGGPLRPLGISLTLIGSVATVTGLVFGGLAKVNDDAARRDACVAAGCSAEGLARIHHADDLATVSTVVTASGLSVAAAGIALWILAPSKPGVVRTAVRPATLLVEGAF